MAQTTAAHPALYFGYLKDHSFSETARRSITLALLKVDENVHGGIYKADAGLNRYKLHGDIYGAFADALLREGSLTEEMLEGGVPMLVLEALYYGRWDFVFIRKRDGAVKAEDLMHDTMQRLALFSEFSQSNPSIISDHLRMVRGYCQGAISKCVAEMIREATPARPVRAPLDPTAQLSRAQLIESLKRSSGYLHKVFAGFAGITESQFKEWRLGRSIKRDSLIREAAQRWAVSHRQS